MKKILVLSILLFIALSAWSQTPALKVYQVTPDSDTTNNRCASIASNSKGDIMVVWRNSYRGMKYYFKKNAATTGALAEIPNEPYPESEGYKIQWTSVRATWDNVFHVVWCNSGPEGGGINYATFDPTTEQWTNPQKITSGWTEDVHLRVSPLNGDLALIWCWYNGGIKYIYVQFKMGGTGAWTNQQIISSKWATNAMSSFDEEGYLYIAWKTDSADLKDLIPAFSMLKKDTNNTYKYLGKVIINDYHGWFFLPSVAVVEKKGILTAAYESMNNFSYFSFERTGDTITKIDAIKPVTASPRRWDFNSIAMPYGEEILYTYKTPSTGINMLKYKDGAFLNEPAIDLNNNMGSYWLYDSQEDPNIGVLSAWSTWEEPNKIFYSVWENPILKVKNAILKSIPVKIVLRSFFRMRYIYPIVWENNPFNVEKQVVVTKFNVYRRKAASSDNWTQIGSVPFTTDTTEFSYADKDVTASSNFEYSVTCVDNLGNESKPK
jgi:hypothetical protein